LVGSSKNTLKSDEIMKMQPHEFVRMKGSKPIAMLTAYTCPVARSLEAAGIPIVLVGDTVGMVEMGFDSTREVTVEHMEYHIGAVRRGAPNTHLIGDLPYNSDKDPEIALFNAERLLAAGADSVKLEGPKSDVISHLTLNEISVVGHTGLTPQTAKSFAKVGRTDRDAKRIEDEAIAIQNAGAFMLVLEHIPYALGKTITGSLDIPTIGIVVRALIAMGKYW
jgi:3-methyl-2-oxobutanoate hydroxymethyltransferase